MAQELSLSRGAISEINADAAVDGPILQVLSIKPIPSGRRRYHRLRMSDGQSSSKFVILASYLNDKVDAGEISQNCIIRINRLYCKNLQRNKKKLVILDLTVLQSGTDVGRRIGQPHRYRQNASSPIDRLQGESFDPIISLIPDEVDWTICARVTRKSDVRNYCTSRGQGKLFTVDFLDDSGEIQATGFDHELDRFYDLLEVNKVYYVSSATIKSAYNQYNELNNDNEMTFNKITEITLCVDDDVVVPRKESSFLPISEIANAEEGTIVDVIGVCRGIGKVKTVGGRSLKKRDIHIIDDSNTKVLVTLWGTEAENFNGRLNCIIALTGAKVEYYKGKKLNNENLFQINPDIEEAHQLKNWFDNGGKNQQNIYNLSKQTCDPNLNVHSIGWFF